MQFFDSHKRYGIITIFLHWLMAFLIIGLFALGAYMVTLTYYDPWYNRALWWHDNLGMVVFGLLIIRLVWVLNNTRPTPLTTYKKIEIKAAKYAHILFYILLLVICISGYLITTAKGASIDVFNGFKVPSIMTLQETQADLVGKVHELASYLLLVLFIVHVIATLKHHFLDKDITFIRMLNPNRLIKSKEKTK